MLTTHVKNATMSLWFVIIIILLLVGYFLFYTMTQKTLYIKVHKKFKVNTHDKIILKVLADDNIEYLIREDPFTSEKKCQDMWDRVKEDELNYVTYNGFDLPILNLKRNIICLY